MIIELHIEDAIFKGSAKLGDGEIFTFDITREEIERYMRDHYKGRLLFRSDGITPIEDRKLIQNYLLLVERFHNEEKKKDLPKSKGGVRENCGRKPYDGEGHDSMTISLKLRKDYVRLIDLNHEGSRSSFIQKAVKDKLRREGLI